MVIDSFRADKCFGDKRTAITPNLDKLIKNGIYFSEAVSSAGATIPSLASLFTGIYPYKSSIKKDDEDHYSINPNIENLLDKLSNNYFQLHAIVPDHFPLLGLTKKFSRITTFNSTFSIFDGIGNQILEFLNSKHNEPWFLYTHLLDLHGSAKIITDEKPKEYEDKKFGDNIYERMLSCLDIWLGKIFDSIDFENTLIIITADHGSEDASYSEEMEKRKKDVRIVEPNVVHKTASKVASRTPKFLKPLKSMLRKKNLENRKKIIQQRQQDEITKINQMELSKYEKRILLHSIKPESHLYDESFHIPLIFHGSPIKSNRIIEKQVKMVDIFPTILELAGIKINEDEIHGNSLVPYLKGNDMIEEPALIDSVGNWNKTNTSNCIGIRTSKYKYFRDKDNREEKLHLFDLVNDPLEENNIANDNESLILNFEKIMSNIINKDFTTEKYIIKQKISKKYKKLHLKKYHE